MSIRPQLETTILRSVSRSFYVSIRFLPAQLREPIALAYLLARTTDTVADTAKISRSVRTETLKMLADGIQGKASREVVVDLITSFVPLQENESERQLLESLPDCLAWLEQMEQTDRTDIRVVLEKIAHGQMLDLQRFDPPTDGFAVVNIEGQSGRRLARARHSSKRFNAMASRATASLLAYNVA